MLQIRKPKDFFAAKGLCACVGKTLCGVFRDERSFPFFLFILFFSSFSFSFFFYLIFKKIKIKKRFETHVRRIQGLGETESKWNRLGGDRVAGGGGNGGRLNIDIPNAQDYFWIRVFLENGCFYRKQI